MPKYLTKEQKKLVIDTYLKEPISLEQLAKKTKVSYPKVLEIIHENNLPLYTRSEIFSPYLKEDFFSTIDTEEKAYFLGLILTDGCIYTKSDTCESLVALTLKDTDKYILEKFKNLLHSNKEITSDKRGAYSIQIYSKIACNF